MDKKLSLTLTCSPPRHLGVKYAFLFGTHLSTAIFVFPIVFLMTDVVGEVYGRETSRMFVRMGFYGTLIFLVFNMISNVVPASLDFMMNSAYNQIFGLSLRFTLASLVAFMVGEYQDVFTFFLLRRVFRGRWFWLRSFLSNFWSQFVDSAIWFGIAFAGVYSFKVIVLTMIPWWLFKVGMGVLYTPSPMGCVAARCK